MGCIGNLIPLAQRRFLSLGAGAALLSVAALVQPRPQDPSLQASFDRDVKPLLIEYCTGCHSGPAATAGLRLDAVTGPGQVLAERSRWELLRKNVANGVMPPIGAPHPTDAERGTIIAWVDKVLAGSRKPGDPGRVTIRRLNRSEYNNTVRDLLYLDIAPAEEFPSDDVGYGFDNIGDVLTLSPLLMEKYLAAAERLAATAIVLPLFKEVRFEASEFGEIRGSSINGEGDRNFFTNGFMGVVFDFPADGDYVLRVKAYGQQAGPEVCKAQFLYANRPVTTIEIPAVRAKPEVYEVPIKAQKGRFRVDVGFVNDYYRPNDPDPRNRDRNLIFQYLEIAGPFGNPKPLPESHRRLITAYPDKLGHGQAAKRVIGDFAKRAFRRPVEPGELDRLMAIYQMVRHAGDPYEKGIQVAVTAVLASPSFIFRPELGSSGLIGQYEMASRLSYFLWSSMPDEELFALAAQSRLQDPKVLEAQVDRMVKSPKSRALADDFAAQWLNLRLLETLSPDPDIFPGFDDRLKADMVTETKLFFLDIVKNDRSIVDFLDSRRTFVNARLARHYGIEGVNTDGFRQAVHTDPNRGGLIAHASMLTVTSNPNRTSPVKRGKWILDNILGGTPPPPPPNVGVIKDDPKAMAESSLRAKMERHRTDPACSPCHAQMDPLGFSLDNFDGVGKWRDMDGKWPIDDSGVLPDGAKFKGAEGLRKILVGRKDDFAKVLAGKLLTYALGRGLEPADDDALEQIQRRTVQNGYRFSELLKGVVTSDAFRMRSPEQ
ncbi:MAG: DUF1592 domain-containing protein [Armatimonadetes bacterium]|nr:DUF1592 domain-containing protein [Armatimonadota bacterium]